MSDSMPSQSPSTQGSSGGGEAGTARPRELTQEEMTMAVSTGAEAAPAATPPSLKGEGGVTAWQNDKKINALWMISQNRNSWVGVVGVGWKKLANNSDSAIVALTALGAHARVTNATVNYREESDGMIWEMYVW